MNYNTFFTDTSNWSSLSDEDGMIYPAEINEDILKKSTNKIYYDYDSESDIVTTYLSKNSLE